MINLHLHTRDLEPQSFLTLDTLSQKLTSTLVVLAFGPRRPSYKLTTHVLIFESVVSS